MQLYSFMFDFLRNLGSNGPKVPIASIAGALSRSGDKDLILSPHPWQKLLELGCRMIVDPAEGISEPGSWIDVIQFCRHDQRVHGRGSLTTSIRSGEQPGFSAEGNTAQAAFGGIVR